MCICPGPTKGRRMVASSEFLARRVGKGGSLPIQLMISEKSKELQLMHSKLGELSSINSSSKQTHFFETTGVT